MDPLASPDTNDPAPEAPTGFLKGRRLPASILAGGAAAAMMLAGLGIANAQTDDSTTTTTTPAAGETRPGPGHRHGPGMKANLDVAATAIGISNEDLRAGLEAGKSIAAIATEHGVDPQKVVDVLAADAKARLAQAVADGKLTQAQADERSANLEARITELVNRTPPAGGPGMKGDGHRGGPKADLSVAAAAIGITGDELRTGLESGKSIAAIATEHGVDPQKVIDAIVADAKAHLAQAVTDGKLTQAQADERSADLEARVTERVNSTPPACGPDGGMRKGPGHGPGMKGGLDAIAGAIGISVDDLRAGLAAGKSMATIAGEHGVDVAKVTDAIVADAKTHLDEAVAAGKLTQAEADQRLADLQSHVDELVNRTGPPAGAGRHHGPKPEGADAPAPADGAEPAPAVLTA